MGKHKRSFLGDGVDCYGLKPFMFHVCFEWVLGVQRKNQKEQNDAAAAIVSSNQAQQPPSRFARRTQQCAISRTP